MSEKNSTASEGEWQRQGVKAAHWMLGVALESMKKEAPAPAPASVEKLTGVRLVAFLLLGCGALVAGVIWLGGIFVSGLQPPVQQHPTLGAAVSTAATEHTGCTKISTTEVLGKDGSLSRTEVREDDVPCEGHSAKESTGMARAVVPGLILLSTLYDLL